MKKILVFLTLAILLVLPVSAVTDAGLEVQTDTVILASGVFDTLVTAIDSSTILTIRDEFKKFIKVNNGGWTYWLQIGRLTGTSKDTSMLAVRVDGYTSNGTLIGSAYSDTSTDRSETYTFKLPIGAGDATCGDLFIADKYVLKFKNTFAATAACQLIINGPIIIRKTRPLNFSTNVTR